MGRGAGHQIHIGLVFGFAALAALCGAPASAEDYPACAKIVNPLAYNQCLATQGPPAHATRAIATPEGADRPWAASQGAGARGRVGSSIQFSRGRNGKMIAEFSIGPAATPARSHRPKKTQ
jgi:hypothetical protein